MYMYIALLGILKDYINQYRKKNDKTSGNGKVKFNLPSTASLYAPATFSVMFPA